MNVHHPIWRIIQSLTILGFLAIVMVFNASNFDETEVKVLLFFGLGLGGLETIKGILPTKKE